MGKIEIELVPSTCWYSNVRSILPKREWDRLRKISYKKADYECEICGGSGLNQGYKHPVECHEIWEYDDKGRIQKLNGLISLCPRCHQVKHIGRTFILKGQSDVFGHMEKVNGWSHRDVVNHVAEAFDLYQKRSKYEWKIDLGILIEDYFVEKKLIIEGQKKSRKVKPPWKKKR